MPFTACTDVDTSCSFMNNHKQIDFHWFICMIDKLITRKELKFRSANRINDPTFRGKLLQEESKEGLVSWIEASQPFSTSYSWFLDDPNF